MRILLTNDDGIFAEGLYELAAALRKAGHELFIGAPAENQSCISHALTLRKPLYADKTVIKGLEGITAYSITGTPSDCVRLSLGNLGAEPDVIISGINHAPNLGTDAVYSGTVSAAIEGYMVDIPSIAVSKDTFEVDHMGDAAKFFADILPELMRFFENGSAMLSVNIPSTDISEYRGVRVARLALQSYPLAFDERTDEDGRTAYTVRSNKLTVCGEDDFSDERYMREGYVVITPLTYDITDSAGFDRAAKLFERDA